MSLRVAEAIAVKDLRMEVRNRSAVSTVLPFAATMLLAFGFALGPDRLLLARTAPALLWLAALFASVELCHRSYQHEAANDALEGLLLSPADKGALYLGKAAAAFVQLTVLLFVTTGIVIVLLGLLAVRSRTRQAALPVLVLPLVSPVIIAATKATEDLTHGSTAGISGWLGLLVAFDAAYLAVGYIVFGHLLED